MRQLRIESVSGATYPISVYISDINLNNKTLISTINSGPVPPTVVINSTIPEIFQSADEVILSLVDYNDCGVFKILDCTYCTYEIIITIN